MLKFSKQLTTLVFLTLIATGGTVPAVAGQAQSRAEKLCRLKPGVNPVCTVLVTTRKGVVIRSGSGFNYQKIGVIPYRHDVNVRVTKSSGEWVKLSNRPGWIYYRYLEMAGD
ncbi:SH3 domain-containing protein [Nostoc sp. NMS4]|uniref:SH3 domain-containing protein n=1 Tax=Nostoc sp. NMS4 TaxID=2815390 RepID=UPI0025EF4644|nr:SH3 domain-containing protein [Nostoc sp. NMS4]MBN3923805.1 SH3 domain-containing protein [Nostoc sp. NMS4]